MGVRWDGAPPAGSAPEGEPLGAAGAPPPSAEEPLAAAGSDGEPPEPEV